MSNKTKILLLAIHYPFALKNYFENAIRRREDLELLTCGVYTGSWIPWLHGMNLPEKYAIPPDIELPYRPNIGKVPYPLVKTKLPEGWIPDIVLTIDAGINWIDKPMDGIVVTVGTDAHCLDYTHARRVSDKFFNLHPSFSVPGDIQSLYAFDPGMHYYDPDIEKDTDAVLGGMPYQKRQEWVNYLSQKGVSVLFENGPVFDEYREMNNRARIGLNWSSSGDLNARVFELMAMKLCPVIDRVPDLAVAGFEENEHYLGFSTMQEAVDAVIWAKENPDKADTIAERAYKNVHRLGHTYDERIRSILQECGF